MNNKSATTAGLLGIFLGFVGAHDWYLGNKNKAMMHVALVGGALLVMFVAGIFLPAVLSYSAYLNIKGTLMGFKILAWLTIVVSEIWGAVEGMMILQRGDEGLVGRNFVVRDPDQNPTTNEQISDTPVILDLNEKPHDSHPEVIFYPQDEN